MGTKNHQNPDSSQERDERRKGLSPNACGAGRSDARRAGGAGPMSALPRIEKWRPANIENRTAYGDLGAPKEIAYILSAHICVQ